MDAYMLGLYEKSMPNTFSMEQKLGLTAACGFDMLELSIDETDEKLLRLDWSQQARQELCRQIEDSGVPIGSICLSGHRKYPMGSRNQEIREKSLTILEKAVVLARDLHIPLIQLAGYDVYYEQGGEDTEKWFAENLCRTCEIAAQHGVLLGFETMETPFMDTVEKAMAWVQKMNSPYLGIYPDIGNLTNAALLYGQEVTADLEKGRGHILAAHLKETQTGVYRDMDFGTGHTPYAACISVLWSMGVRRFTGEFWYKNEPQPADTITAAGVFLRTQIERGMQHGV